MPSIEVGATIFCINNGFVEGEVTMGRGYIIQEPPDWYEPEKDVAEWLDDKPRIARVWIIDNYGNLSGMNLDRVFGLNPEGECYTDYYIQKYYSEGSD